MVKVNEMINTIDKVVSKVQQETSIQNTKVKETNKKDEKFEDLLKEKQDNITQTVNTSSTKDNKIKSVSLDSNKANNISKNNNFVMNDISNTKSTLKDNIKKLSKDIKFDSKAEVESLEEEIEKDVEKVINDILEYLNSLFNVLQNTDIKNNVVNAENAKSVTDALLKVDNVDTNLKELTNSVNSMMALLDNKNIETLMNADKLSGIESVLKQLSGKLATISEGDNTFTNILKDIHKTIEDIKSIKKVNEENAGISIQNETDYINLAASNEKSDMTVDKTKTSSTLKDAEVKVENNQPQVVVDVESRNNSEEFNGQSNNSDKNSLFSKDEKILNSLLDGKDTNVSDNFALAVNRVQIQNTTPVTNQIQPVNEGSMSRDITNNIKTMVTNGIKEVTVKVNPEKLGEISIKIIDEAGVMKAEIKAKSKETYSLLSQQMASIKKQLETQNIKIQEVNISIYDDDTTFYKDGQFTDSSSFMNDNDHDNKSNNKNQQNGHYSEYNEDEEDNEIDPYKLNNINMWV